MRGYSERTRVTPRRRATPDRFAGIAIAGAIRTHTLPHCGHRRRRPQFPGESTRHCRIGLTRLSLSCAGPAGSSSILALKSASHPWSIAASMYGMLGSSSGFIRSGGTTGCGAGSALGTFAGSSDRAAESEGWTASMIDVSDGSSFAEAATSET